MQSGSTWLFKLRVLGYEEENVVADVAVCIIHNHTARRTILCRSIAEVYSPVSSSNALGSSSAELKTLQSYHVIHVSQTGQMKEDGAA